MVTKKIGKVTFAFEPNALNGKGWWFILGKNGALGRAASLEEGQKLGKPKDKQVYPPKNADKTKSAPKDTKDDHFSAHGDDRYYYDIGKTGRNAGKPVRRAYRTGSEYEKYDVLRRKTFSQLANERMMTGEGIGASIKGALGDRIAAKSSAIKKKFDPLNILSKLPGVGSMAATAYGMKRKRDPSDISYFTGIQPPGKVEEVDKEEGGSKERKTKTSYKKISNDKSSVGILKKIHNVLVTKFKSDDDWKEEQSRQAEIDSNFREEQSAEADRKHKELIDALLGKSKKPEKAKKEKKEEGGFFSNLLSLFKGFMPKLGSLFTGLMSTIGGFLSTAISGIVSGLSAILAPLASVLLPLIAVIGGVMLAAKGISWLASKITGKPMDYMDKGEYDKKTTPKDVQKDFQAVGGGETGMGHKMTQKEYENNKKTIESDKPVAGFQNGKWVQDVRPGLKKMNDAYDRVQEYKKTSDDPLQQYRRDVEAGNVKRETSFEEWKKQKGITQDTATKITPAEPAAPTAVPQKKETASVPTNEDPTQHPNYKKYLAEELKTAEMAGNTNYGQDAAYKRAQMRARADMIQDQGKEKQLTRLNQATTENQNLQTATPATVVPIVNNTNNIVSGSAGGGVGVPMGVRNEEPVLLQTQYGKVRPV